jgi:hypothetical protein
MMHGHEKSDSVIVAAKPANKAERSAAELVEPRAETKGNAGWQSTLRTQSRACVSQALARMRQAFAVRTRGGSRMRESRTYGFVRGALSNERPYRVLIRQSSSTAAMHTPLPVWVKTGTPPECSHVSFRQLRT